MVHLFTDQRSFRYWLVSIRLEKREHWSYPQKSKKNYRPVSLLPIISLIVNKLFNLGSNLDILALINYYPQHTKFTIHWMRDWKLKASFWTFLKFLIKCGTKTFFKISQNSISGNLLDLLSSFLSDRKERVIFNGQTSEWRNVTVGAPQGSILGPLLFLIYINDLFDGLSSKAKLFAAYPLKRNCLPMIKLHLQGRMT